MPEIFEGFVDVVLPGGDGLIRRPTLGDVFVGNVVAGDTILFKIGQKKRGVWRGELVEILKPALQRVNPPCAVALSCGGCALQAMSPVEQASLKTSWVTQAFQNDISASTEIIPLQPQTHAFAGRRRVRWFVANKQLGFRQRYSHQIIPTSECVALSQTLDVLRQQLNAHLQVLPDHIQSIQAIELSNGTHIVLESEHQAPAHVELPEMNHCQWWWRSLGSPAIKPLQQPVLPLFDHIDANPFSEQPIPIQIGPNDFIQGHAQGNQTLIHQILNWSEGSQRVVDLFSGCGNLSLPIASALGAKVIGAELNQQSVQAANQNAKRLGLNAKYETLDLFGKFNIEPFIAADILIIDPPRKGAKNICHKIQQFFPRQIIMVNCDPAAGGRDAKALQQAGFKLKALRPLDLFPYAGHVEAVSLWVS